MLRFLDDDEEELTPLEEAKRAVYRFMDDVEKKLKKRREFLSDYIFIIDKKYFDIFMEDEDFRNSCRGSIYNYGGYRVKRGQAFGLIDSIYDYD